MIILFGLLFSIYPLILIGVLDLNRLKPILCKTKLISRALILLILIYFFNLIYLNNYLIYSNLIFLDGLFQLNKLILISEILVFILIFINIILFHYFPEKPEHL